MTRKPSLPRDPPVSSGARSNAKSKVIIFQLALPVTILAIAFSGVVRADGRGAHYSHGLGAKLDYCTDCHGPSGRGYRGFYVMPRLAGQTPEYLENQLRAFVEGTRESHNGMIMSRVHGVGPSTRSALAEQFADLNPRPYGRAPGGLAETGRQIYEEGIPDANVPACSVCHGPEAKGKGPIPRLAGLTKSTIAILVLLRIGVATVAGTPCDGSQNFITSLASIASNRAQSHGLSIMPPHQRDAARKLMRELAKRSRPACDSVRYRAVRTSAAHFERRRRKVAKPSDPAIMPKAIDSATMDRLRPPR